ncbi:MAG: mucin-binding protein, partial [Lactobacillus kalixensis]|uniref:mucin-binding protein n=1 Tax=Lactobacillus kalixensis TaxID=227944 RepID=UPI0039943351
TFRHGQIPVGPDTPDKHGVDPNEVTKNVKETVHYVGAGDKTPADNVQTSKWTRTVTVDVVTGNVIADGQYTTDWSIAKGEKSVYDQVDTPIVEGYHADKRQVNATAVTQNDIEVTVTYTPNGKIIAVDPEGNPIPNVPTPQYPTDPTKVTPDEPVPEIPGYTPSVPSVTPTDPGKDTPVPYTPSTPVTPEIPGQPTTPVNPTSPDQPTTPETPTPQQPVTPQPPTPQPTAPTPTPTEQTNKPRRSSDSNRPKSQNENVTPRPTVNSRRVPTASTSVSNEKKDTLPQTGEKNSSILSTLGLALLNVVSLGLFAVVSKKRRKKN